MSYLTIDTLREAIRNFPKDPLEEFANEHGFSVLAGDKLVLPNSMKTKVGDHLGIIYSRFVGDDACYLINPEKAGIRPLEENNDLSDRERFTYTTLAS